MNNYSIQRKIPKWGKKTYVNWSLNPNGKAIVFIHGFNGSSMETFGDFNLDFRVRPKYEGYDVYFFSYQSLFSQISNSAIYFLDFLTAIHDDIKDVIKNSGSTEKRKGNYTKIVIVAHSLGAVVNTAFSYAEGDRGYELVKSGLSGFFSGAVLGSFSKVTSLGGLFAGGASSGATGEFVNQIFDNTFGKGDGSFDLKKILVSAGIGGVANIIASKVIDYANGLIDKKAAEYITLTKSNAYKETLKKAIKEEAPRITPQSLKKAINKRIYEVQQLIKKQAQVEKQAAKQGIERTVDLLQDKTTN